jgi:hypothetical protein
MDAKLLNDRLQLVASVGVIIGLIVLVVEIRQNSEIARTNTFVAILDSWNALTIAEFESDVGVVFEKSMEAPEDLTTAELHKLGAWLQSMTQVWQLQMELNQSVVTPILLDEIGAEAFYFFGNHATRAWYKENRYWMSAEMLEILDTEIAANPLGADKAFFDRMKESIRKGVEETTSNTTSAQPESEQIQTKE